MRFNYSKTYDEIRAKNIKLADKMGIDKKARQKFINENTNAQFIDKSLRELNKAEEKGDYGKKARARLEQLQTTSLDRRRIIEETKKAFRTVKPSDKFVTYRSFQNAQTGAIYESATTDRFNHLDSMYIKKKRGESRGQAIIRHTLELITKKQKEHIEDPTVKTGAHLTMMLRDFVIDRSYKGLFSVDKDVMKTLDSLSFDADKVIEAYNKLTKPNEIRCFEISFESILGLSTMSEIGKKWDSVNYSYERKEVNNSPLNQIGYGALNNLSDDEIDDLKALLNRSSVYRRYFEFSGLESDRAEDEIDKMKTAVSKNVHKLTPKDIEELRRIVDQNPLNQIAFDNWVRNVMLK